MRKINRREILKSTLAVGSALTIPGAAFAQQSPRRGGTLRVAMPFNPASVDPMTGRNLPDFNTLYAMFDTLIDFEPKTLALKPGLAKSWQFADPKTLVLELIEGVKFHDGTSFDAEAVKINLERYKNDQRSNVKADLTTLAGVEINGPSSVTLKLVRPNSGLPTMLTNRIGCMVSPKSLQEKGSNIDRVAVGTGPFKFVEWQDNASFKLVRNENYWKEGLPYLDAVDIRIINDLNTLARALIAGEADVGLNLTVQQKLLADKAGGLTTETVPALTFFGAFLNYAKPPLNDRRVRQAMNYALDRDEINKVVMYGLGEPTSAILSRQHWACDPETAGYYNHDVDKAKKLLAEAGYPNGLEIETFGWSDQLSMQRQELLVAQWAKAGIRIKLTPMAPQQAMQVFMLETKGSMLLSPTGGYPDPSQFYEALFGKDALRNSGKIELPGFRDLLDATIEAPDQATRKAAFAKLQRFVIEEALQIPQFINLGVTVRSAKVKNFVDGILTTPKFNEVWLEA